MTLTTVGRASARVFLGRCVGAAASLGYGLLLADVLAPSAMGEFVIAVSAATIAATVSKCGLDVYLVRRAAERPWAAQRLAARCAMVAGLAGTLFWVLSIPVGVWARPDAGWAFAVFQFAVPFMAMSFVLAGLLKAGNLPAAAVFFETGGWPTAMCACAIAMRLAGSDSLPVVAVCFAAAAGLSFAGLLGIAVRLVFHAETPGVRSPAGPGVAIREVASLAAVSVGQVLMRWSDTLWLAWWLDPQAVATYAVCTRLVAGIGFVDHAVNAVAAPRFARHHGRGDTRILHREFGRAVAVSAAFGVVAATSVALLAQPVLAWLGPPYAESTGILQVAAALMAVHVALVPVGHLAAMTGRSMDHLKATVALLALQQVAYVLLIPRFGMAAALVGFALPQALANVLTLTMLRRRRELGWQRR